MHHTLAAFSAASLAIAAPAFADFDLATYMHTGGYALPAVAASEASAVAWNWDNDHLYVLGDEGDALVEVTRAGAVVSTMTLTDFADTEGLTYIGGGQLVLDEERLQDVYSLSYTAGATVSRKSLQSASIGPTIGNTGIEGVAYDRLSGRYICVKEKTPQAVYDVSVDFAASTAVVNSLFVPNLGVLDLSDVAVLNSVTALAGSADADNLLILSQESARLLEVSRSGVILSQFDLSGLGDNIEGVTITADGTIFLCAETPEMFVLTQIPAPGSVCLFGLAALAARRRR